VPAGDERRELDSRDPPMNFYDDCDTSVSDSALARVLARPAAAPRLIALAELAVFGEPLLDEVVDGRMERIQATQLLTLELGKRCINTRNSRRHWRSFEDMPTCPTSGYKVREVRIKPKFFLRMTRATHLATRRKIGDVVAACYALFMTRIVAVANQKGGVGKTTTAINVAASIASRGYRVLLVDFDPQGNASSGVGYPRDKVELTVYDALVGDVRLEDVIRPTDITTLFVAPATTDLVGAEIELIGAESRERFLANALAPVAAQYDYVILDCPPSLGILTLNALVAADGVLVPMQAEYFALEGLSALTATIEKVRAAYNPHLKIDGVLFTMFDGRMNLATQVRAEVTKYFGDSVLETTIPRNVRLSEAPSHGKPVLLYDLRCPGTKSYLAVADEFLDRTLIVGASKGDSVA
jgi:chromosome partitioning protein